MMSNGSQTEPAKVKYLYWTFLAGLEVFLIVLEELTAFCIFFQYNSWNSKKMSECQSKNSENLMPKICYVIPAKCIVKSKGSSNQISNFEILSKDSFQQTAAPGKILSEAR